MSNPSQIQSLVLQTLRLAKVPYIDPCTGLLVGDCNDTCGSGGSGGPTTNVVNFIPATNQLVSTVNGVVSSTTIVMDGTDILTTTPIVINGTSYPAGTTIQAIATALASLAHVPATLTNTNAAFSWDTPTQVGNIPQSSNLVDNGDGTATFTRGDGSAPVTINLGSPASVETADEVLTTAPITIDGTTYPTATSVQDILLDLQNSINFTVSTGPDGVVTNATQTVTINPGDNIHFYSSNSTIDFDVTLGSAIVDGKVVNLFTTAPITVQGVTYAAGTSVFTILAALTSGSTPTVSDTGTIDLTLLGNDISGIIIGSDTATNGQVPQSDGAGGLVWVTPSAGHAAVTTVDSNTVNFTQSGIDNQTITADVKISNTTGNDITSDANGLFLDVQASETTTSITGTVIGHTIGTYINEDAVATSINETVTSIGYSTLTKILSYTDETGSSVNVDLSGLATDIFVDGATYNSTTGLLTLTDNSGTTPDVTVQIHPPVVTNDSGSIDFTQSGTDNQTITAILSGADSATLNQFPASDGAGNIVWTSPLVTAARHDLRLVGTNLERGSDSATATNGAEFLHDSYSHLVGFSDNWIGSNGATHPTLSLKDNGDVWAGATDSASADSINTLFFDKSQGSLIVGDHLAGAYNIGINNILFGKRNFIASNLNNCSITGGQNNRMIGDGIFSLIGGGLNNTIGYTGGYSVIVGGYNNSNNGFTSTIAGGSSNTTSGSAAFIGAGDSNNASGTFSAVVGGTNNISGSAYTVVGGGTGNNAAGYASGIFNGAYNTTSGQYSSIFGGIANTASGDESLILSGSSNLTSGRASYVLGGVGNTASNFLSGNLSGQTNTVSGYDSVNVLGYRNVVSATHAFNSGMFNTVQSYYQQSLGPAGVIFTGNPTSYDVNDVVFTVNNGDMTNNVIDGSTALRISSTAITTLKTGATQINNYQDGTVTQSEAVSRPKAALEVTSHTSGIIPPQLTDSQAVARINQINTTPSLTKALPGGWDDRIGETWFNLDLGTHERVIWGGTAYIKQTF